MADLDFSLPNSSNPSPATRSKGGLSLLLLLQLVIILLLCFLAFRRSPQSVAATSSLSSDQQLEFAQRLERQGLTEAAVQAWQEYINISQPDPEKAAKLWYRIAVIQQDGRLYEQALASFYRSESLHAVDVLAPEISRRTQECLLAMGKVAGLRRNLEERTSVAPADQQAGEQVLAEIGAWKITRAELENIAEQMINMQIESSGMTPEQAAEQKKAMLKNLSHPDNLQSLLAQVIQEELLYRDARDSNLHAEESVRNELQHAERNILASAAIRRRLGKIMITDSDVQDFILAHQDSFQEPPAVRLAHILFADEEKAKAAASSTDLQAKFSDLAQSLSLDEATASKQGEIPGWQNGFGEPSPYQELAQAVLRQSNLPAAGTVLTEPIKTSQGWHVVKVLETKPATKLDLKDERVFAEARNQLSERRQREIQAAMFQELSQRYQVLWHQNAPGMRPNAAVPTETPPAANGQ